MQYIRVDSNENIGIGHLMRCLAIADTMRSLGEKVIFIIADHCCENKIHALGFETICLESQWDSLESEIDKLRALIRNRSIESLVIDSYFVTKFYLERIRELTRVIYIDDLNAMIYPVDLLINYNIYADELNYPQRYHDAGLNTEFALGCTYAPLRREFLNLERVTKPKISRVLITSGGTG